MRFPSLPSVVKAFYTLSNVTAQRTAAAHQALGLFTGSFNTTRLGLIRSSMPIPIIGSLFSSSASKKMSYPLEKSDDEWRAQLSPEQFRIIREKGTEAPGSGKYNKHYPSEGVYSCAGCAAPLYKAEHKFDSGCGWPAYFDAIPGAVTRHTDRTFGMARTEIVCSNCGGHLGHVFKGEKFGNPIDERHCVNSVSINFGKEDAQKAGAIGRACLICKN